MTGTSYLLLTPSVSTGCNGASGSDVASSAAESSSQVGVGLGHDGGLRRDVVEIAPLLLARFAKVAVVQPFYLFDEKSGSLMLPRYGTGSYAVLLTGRRAAGPEVLDAVEDLIECRFKRGGVAANLREHDAAFDRGQQRSRQAVGVGLAA